ncbi:unnamed protein product [Eruca vesicaria subsp. sativa]|uniref:Uncharacterized protein n=1 Tax=Eruca vesicaria subsp. sativa TaxID=29727 RepID=A0ABC8IP58_ERUVS|nr:unnamed protein product [Eruca vesicaria subsp. sativa]
MVLPGLQRINVNTQVDIDLPQSPADIVGSTYTSQLRLKDFSFTANPPNLYHFHHISARELTPMPTLAEGVQVPEAVAPGSDSGLANTCKVAEQATTSDVSLLGRLTAAKEQVDNILYNIWRLTSTCKAYKM